MPAASLPGNPDPSANEETRYPAPRNLAVRHRDRIADRRVEVAGPFLRPCGHSTVRTLSFEGKSGLGSQDAAFEG